MPLFAASPGGLSSVDHYVIAGYLASMLMMGGWIALRQRSTDDFFLGGRNLPSWVVGISLYASLLSTITYLGKPGEMFRTGLNFLARDLGIPFVLLVVWFLWIPFFMRLRLTSAYEYLERRFDYATRALAAVFCLLLLFVPRNQARSSCTISAMPFETNSGEFRDADLHAIILSVGLFSVLYTTLGGLRAVVWTDLVQFCVLVAGAFVTMGTVAWLTGSGLGDWIATSQQHRHEPVEWFSWDVGTRSTFFTILLGMFFWQMCTHGANQVALQRYFSVRDVWAARRSFLVNGLASVGVGVILAGVGISLMHFVQHHDTSQMDAIAGLSSESSKIRNECQDRVFPQFIRSGYFPDGLRGLVVAALFAAAMSSIDSGANSVSTIVTVDFFRRLGGDRGPKAELRLARMLTATMGLLIVALSILLYHLSKGTNLIDLCQKGFNCFLGPLGALFVLAMFSKRATAASVIPAVLVGEVVGICASYSSDLFGRNFSTHLVVPAAWLATIVSCQVFALVLGTRATPEQQRWMWRAVVRGPGARSEEGGRSERMEGGG